MQVEGKHVQIAVALLVVLYGVVGLWNHSMPASLTGLVLYNGSDEVQWVSPTPSDDALVNALSLVLNLSVSENVSGVVLEWEGVNESMSQSGSFWSLKKNSSGTFSYQAFAAMWDNSTLQSERRTVRYGYLVLGALANRDTLEDTPLSISFSSIVTAHDKDDLSYALSLSNDKLACSLAGFNISCSPKANETGRANITLTAADGPITVSTSFIVNITQVNDPTYLKEQFPITRTPEHKNASLKLTDYIADLEGDALNYSVENASLADAFVKDTKLWIIPKSAGFGSLNLSVSDGNSTTSFSVPINITENHPPQVYETLTIVNWTENNVGTLRLTQVFYDPDGDFLQYNFTPVENMSTSLSSQSLFFVPNIGWTGERMVVVRASDGEFQAERTLILRVNPLLGGVAQESPSVSLPDPVAEEFPLVLPSLTWPEDTETSVELMDFVALDALKQETLQISVTGTSAIRTSIQGSVVRFIPNSDFYGAETAMILVTDGEKAYRGSLTLVVENALDSLEASSLPAIILNENATSQELDLSSYFTDPDGSQIDFDVVAGEGVNVSFKSKSVVVFSLAGGRSGNTSARIIARASNGRELSKDLLVTLVDAIRTDRAWGKLFLQALVVLLLSSIVGLAGYRYQNFASERSARLSKVNKSIEEVYGDPEMQRVLKAQAMQHHKVITPSERFMKFFDESITKIAKLYQDLLVQKKNIYAEPANLRKEVLYMKETISGLRAIITSTNDRMIASALKAEKDKLMRAYHSVQGKAELSRDELRKLLLYAMESSSALQEISAVSEDMLITFEVRKQASRMRKVLDSLSFKLEDSYHR